MISRRATDKEVFAEVSPAARDLARQALQRAMRKQRLEENPKSQLSEVLCKLVSRSSPGLVYETSLPAKGGFRTTIRVPLLDFWPADGIVGTSSDLAKAAEQNAALAALEWLAGFAPQAMPNVAHIHNLTEPLLTSIQQDLWSAQQLPCREGSNCRLSDCQLAHFVWRPPECKFGINCTRQPETCIYRHPRCWYERRQCAVTHPPREQSRCGREQHEQHEPVSVTLPAPPGLERYVVDMTAKITICKTLPEAAELAADLPDSILTLYVKNLPPDVDRSELQRAFAAFGGVSKCFICDGSKRWARVNLKERGAAENLLKLGYVKLGDGRTLELSVYKQHNKITTSFAARPEGKDLAYTRDQLLASLKSPIICCSSNIDLDTSESAKSQFGSEQMKELHEDLVHPAIIMPVNATDGSGAVTAPLVRRWNRILQPLT